MGQVFHQLTTLDERRGPHISVDFPNLLWCDGVLRHPDAQFTSLGGGVSSEIFRVDDGEDVFVVKRALARLKVKDEWTADVGRNRYERMYIDYVRRFLPQAVPFLRDGPSDRGYFAMEFLGAEFTSWKDFLLGGIARTSDAHAAGVLLGQIHAYSAGDAEAKLQFDTTSNFFQLRINPYLLTTAKRHPDLSDAFHAEADRLVSARQCMVRWDFSPKNLMISD